MDDLYNAVQLDKMSQEEINILLNDFVIKSNHRERVCLDILSDINNTLCNSKPNDTASDFYKKLTNKVNKYFKT